MGLFTRPRARNVQLETAEQRILRETAVKLKAEKAKTKDRRIAAFASMRRDVGFEAGRAAGVGMRQEVSFSREQQMLGQMFGQGEKIWGTNNEPVRINNDLNSSRSDPFDETSSMFGFGDQGGGRMELRARVSLPFKLPGGPLGLPTTRSRRRRPRSSRGPIEH